MFSTSPVSKLLPLSASPFEPPVGISGDNQVGSLKWPCSLGGIMTEEDGRLIMILDVSRPSMTVAGGSEEDREYLKRKFLEHYGGFRLEPLTID